MSRAYRISVSGSVDRVVHVEDGVCTPLELLPILAKERMRELLAAELARRGFTRDAERSNVVRRDEGEGVTIEVDVDAGTVTARAGKDAEVKVTRERTTSVVEEHAVEGRARAQRAVDAEVERHAREAEETARREVTQALEKKLKDLKKELDQAVNRVTAEALKEKARQMGEIEEMLEDQETGALTIKVRV